MILVLCTEPDPAAVWAAAGLRARGAEAVLVGAAELTCALRVEHTVDDGGARVELDLPLGRGFSSETVDGVLNRLAVVPPPATPGVDAADLDYAQAELTALTLSWLWSLAQSGVPFVGRPHAAGLAGEWRYPAEWAVLAEAAGLETAPVELGGPPPGAAAGRPPGAAAGPPPPPGARAGVVLLGRAFGDVPPAARAAVVRLAELADAASLGVAFDTAGRFAGADLLPDLRRCGAPGLGLLAEALGAQVQSVAGPGARVRSRAGSGAFPSRAGRAEAAP